MSDSPCPNCNGTGWKTVERQGISGVERCGCIAEGRATRLEGKANIPPLYENSSFENFSTCSDNPITYPILSKAISMARAYAREFPPQTKKGLLFVGDSGTGKTHLAVAVLRMLMERGHECVFFLYQNLLERIQRSYDKTGRRRGPGSLSNSTRL